jgi:hypothetical protein
MLSQFVKTFSGKVKSLCNRNNLLKLHAHYARMQSVALRLHAHYARMQSVALRLHAHYARMQSVALQSSATPCGSHGYRHEEALALRARLRGFAATLGTFNNSFS